MNEILLVISIIGVFSMLLIVKNVLGESGVIGWIGIASILANILITKSINLFGISATLGNVLFASNFLATDILTENYGVRSAKKGVLFGIFSVLFFLIVTQVSLLFIPNELDVANDSLMTIFSLTPRICLASIVLFALSNILDVKLYEYLRIKTNGKYMWFRNNVSTILCNGTENFIFYFIAFGGIFSAKEILLMGASASIIEIVIALCDTPFLYLSKKSLPKLTILSKK